MSSTVIADDAAPLADGVEEDAAGDAADEALTEEVVTEAEDEAVEEAVSEPASEAIEETVAPTTASSSNRGFLIAAIAVCGLAAIGGIGAYSVKKTGKKKD